MILYLHYIILLNNLTGGDDYVAGPFNVTIKKGTKSIYFNISIKDDDLYEGNEKFKCFIGEDTPKGIVQASPHEAIVEIIDDECK